MKVSRNFRAKAGDGQISIKAQVFIPLTLNVYTARLTMNDPERDGGLKTFIVKLNGEDVFTGVMEAGKETKFDPPIKLLIGRPSLSVISLPYVDGTEVSGRIELNVSIF